MTPDNLPEPGLGSMPFNGPVVVSEIVRDWVGEARDGPIPIRRFRLRSEQVGDIYVDLGAAEGEDGADLAVDEHVQISGEIFVHESDSAFGLLKPKIEHRLPGPADDR